MNAAGSFVVVRKMYLLRSPPGEVEPDANVGGCGSGVCMSILDGKSPLIVGQ